LRVRVCAVVSPARASACTRVPKAGGRGSRGGRVAGQVVKQPPHDFLARAIPSGGETERERERGGRGRGGRRAGGCGVCALVPRTYRARHAIESRAFVSIKLPDKRTHRRVRPVDTHRRACHDFNDYLLIPWALSSLARRNCRFLRRSNRYSEQERKTTSNCARCSSIAMPNRCYDKIR